MLVGPGGIGKTTLAHWLATRALERGGTVAWVSGEQVAPNPEAVLNGIRFSSEIVDRVTLDDLGRGERRDLLVIDSFEKLRPICGWLFGELLGEIGPNLLVLLATRERLAPADAAHMGVPGPFLEIDVGPLDETHAHALLLGCGVPHEQLESIYSFAGGHPLALRLAADRSLAGAPGLDGSDRARVIDALVESFVAHVPSPMYAKALYAAAVAPFIDQPLLAAMVGSDGAGEQFGWLTRSAFMEQTALGISPHALVRAFLFADIQRRDPELLLTLQSRLVDGLMPRLVASDISTAHDVYLQAVYAQRNRPQVAHYGALELAKRCTVVPLNGGALGQVRALVSRFEGPAGLRSFDAWSHQEAFSAAILGEAENVESFQRVIRVARDADESELTDPLIRDSWRAWRHREPPPDEGDLFLFRWFMESESHNGLTPAMGHLFTLGPLLTLPRMTNLVHIAFVVSPPERWGPLAASFQLVWDEGRETEFAGRRYCHSYGSLRRMAGADWGKRDVGPRLLRNLLYQQFGLPLSSEEMPAEPAAPALTLDSLSRALPGFLSELQLPTAQHRSPITEALMRRGVPCDRSSLIAWTEAGIEALASAQRTARYAAVLRATYLSTSPKQLAAAGDLGLPFGTYRYQLRKGQELLARELWNQLAARD